MKTSEPQLSEWINGSIKPTMVGVYQRYYGSSTIYYCMWTGTRWLCAGGSPMHADRIRALSGAQDLEWRGLRYDPALSQVLAS